MSVDKMKFIRACSVKNSDKWLNCWLLMLEQVLCQFQMDFEWNGGLSVF